MKTETSQKGLRAWLQKRIPALRENAALLFSALGILLSIFNMAFTEQVRLKQQRLDELFQPIVYTLSWEDSTRYRYRLQSGGREWDFPAKTTWIDITRGGIRQIAALSFDGESVRVLNSFEIQAAKERRDRATEKTRISVDTEPQYPPLTEDRLLYDYFFIWIEALSGEQRLDMICHVIDLESGQVSETLRWSRPQLLEYVPGAPENAREILLERYWELARRAEALPGY